MSTYARRDPRIDAAVIEAQAERERRLDRKADLQGRIYKTPAGTMRRRWAEAWHERWYDTDSGKLTAGALAFFWFVGALLLSYLAIWLIASPDAFNFDGGIERLFDEDVEYNWQDWRIVLLWVLPFVVAIGAAWYKFQRETDGPNVVKARRLRNGAIVVAVAVVLIPGAALGEDDDRPIQPGITAPPSDTESPTAPSDLTFEATDDQVTLDWERSTDNEGVSGYQVERDEIVIASPTASSYVDDSVGPGTEYTYEVTAIDEAGNVSDGSDITVTTSEGFLPPERCPEGYRVKLAPHKRERIDSSGFEGSAKKFTSELIELTGRDPYALQDWWNTSFPKRKPIRSASGVVRGDKVRDGACYTKEAVRKHEFLARNLKLADRKNVLAPGFGTNTGVANGQVFQHTGPLTGDRRATAFKLPSGRVVLGLHRCKNAFLPGKVNIPGVPSRPKPPQQPKCDPSKRFCGTPTSGPEQYHADDPGRTPGYPGNAEGVVDDQPVSDDIDTDCGRHGCDSGGDAPGGETDGPGGEEEGTNDGTDNPDDTEGSDEDSEGDPCDDPDPPPYCP